MELYITMDEFGRYWVLDENNEPFHGPYDTKEEADEAVLEDE
jgi:hypothetical protein